MQPTEKSFRILNPPNEKFLQLPDLFLLLILLRKTSARINYLFMLMATFENLRTWHGPNHKTVARGLTSLQNVAIGSVIWLEKLSFLQLGCSPEFLVVATKMEDF